MALFGKRINPATGRPHSDDKKIGADRKGRARRKKELDAWAAKTQRKQARLVSRRQQRAKAGLN